MSSTKRNNQSPPAPEESAVVYRKQDAGTDSNLEVDAIHDDLVTNEQDAQKLEQETSYLTSRKIFFPDLVWKQVLDKMKKTTYIENCSNASPYFGKVLKNKRIESIVLPKVFIILSKRYANENNKDESYRESKPKTHPLIGFWKLRLVSKSWNKAIENMHQRLEKDDVSNDTSNGSNLFDWTIVKFAPFEDKPPSKFLDHFETTHYDKLLDKSKKNPFLGRFACMYFPWFESDYEIMTDYTEGVDEMLRKYGGELWCCSLFSYSPPSTIHHLNFYKELIRLTKLMPNLKMLLVQCIIENDPLFVLFGNEIVLDEEQMEFDLDREIGGIEFPFLPNLKAVVTVNLSSVIVDQIRIRNPQAGFK